MAVSSPTKNQAQVFIDGGGNSGHNPASPLILFGIVVVPVPYLTVLMIHFIWLIKRVLSPYVASTNSLISFQLLPGCSDKKKSDFCPSSSRRW
jgi:hypothetical protein